MTSTNDGASRLSPLPTLGGVVDRVRRSAPYRAARWVYRASRARLTRVLFARGQLDTAAPVSLDALGLGAPNRNPYEPASWSLVRRALRGAPITRSDVFVDIGSGKGRAVYLAAKDFPFGRVIGVELSEELSEVARTNIARTRHKLRCKDVELITCDAIEYAIPDDVTYAFIYNPFVGDLFLSLLSNIVASLERNPRLLTICYHNPVMADAVLATGRFRHVTTRSALLRTARPFQVAIFTSLDS